MSRVQSIASKAKMNKNNVVSKKMTLRRNIAPPSDEESVYETEDDDEESEWIDESDEEDVPSEADEYTTDDGFVVKDGDGENENANEVMDQVAYRKFLQTLFPSKYAKQRVENAKKEKACSKAVPTTETTLKSCEKNGKNRCEKEPTNDISNTTEEGVLDGKGRVKYNLRSKKTFRKNQKHGKGEMNEKDAANTVKNSDEGTLSDAKSVSSHFGGDPEKELLEETDTVSDAENGTKVSKSGSETVSDTDSDMGSKQEKRVKKSSASKKKKGTKSNEIIILLNSSKPSKKSTRDHYSDDDEEDDDDISDGEYYKRYLKDAYDSDEEYDSSEETEDEDAPIEDSDSESDSENDGSLVDEKSGDKGKNKKSSNKSKQESGKNRKKDEDNVDEETKEKGTKESIKEKNGTGGEGDETRQKGKLVRVDLVKERDYLQAKVEEAKLQLKEKTISAKFAKQCIAMNEKMLKKVEAKIEKYDRKEKERNERIFDRIIQDKHAMNDHSFYRKLDAERQKWVIKQMREINGHTRVVKPYRMTILDLEIPMLYKAIAMKKVELMQDMMHEMGASGEYFKVKQWLDTFMQIPFGKYLSLPVTMQTPTTPENEKECQDFICNAAKTLDEVVYGMEDAKIQIMQMLSLLITNPNAVGNAIAIHGPMGCGKTTLIREGVSRILNRPFELIALGGATDSSFLEGTGYVYEGSMCGKIVQILMHSKCMNPVIYFDELDKISDTAKGDEITNILTHLTDTSQNSEFHDKYFSEFAFDLSKCLFIFSYNDGSKVNSILKDRMYHIHTKGYGVKEKTIIAEQYLIPKMYQQVKMAPSMVQITQQALTYLINNRCNNEEGVRNLKRCIETIYYKINMCRLLDPQSMMYKRIMETNTPLVFPCVVDDKMAAVLVKDRDETNLKWKDMFV